jgi:hypothetical protein
MAEALAATTRDSNNPHRLLSGGRVAFLLLVAALVTVLGMYYCHHCQSSVSERLHGGTRLGSANTTTAATATTSAFPFPASNGKMLAPSGTRNTAEEIARRTRLERFEAPARGVNDGAKQD